MQVISFVHNKVHTYIRTHMPNRILVSVIPISVSSVTYIQAYIGTRRRGKLYTPVMSLQDRPLSSVRYIAPCKQGVLYIRGPCNLQAVCQNDISLWSAIICTQHSSMRFTTHTQTLPLSACMQTFKLVYIGFVNPEVSRVLKTTQTYNFGINL